MWDPVLLLLGLRREGIEDYVVGREKMLIDPKQSTAHFSLPAFLSSAPSRRRPVLGRHRGLRRRSGKNAPNCLLVIRHFSDNFIDLGGDLLSAALKITILVSKIMHQSVAASDRRNACIGEVSFTTA